MKTRASLPRVVLVTRPTLYEQMLARHGTAGQAAFFLKGQGRDIHDYEIAHRRFQEALSRVRSLIPQDQRRTRVDRDELPSFLFAPDDVVVVVGQDGLVPNVAKYLADQPVVGVNPSPETYDGVLCPFGAEEAGRILGWLNGGASGPAAGNGAAYAVQRRVMAEARTDDGQRLVALNDIFVGHRTHQSARYVLRHGEKSERQSSSGLLCATGTGATGWARSIVGQRGLAVDLPAPDEPRVAWFVREPFPSVSTGTSLDHGFADEATPLTLVSEMGEGGALFADGIESDRIDLPGGCGVRIGIAATRLRLVFPVRGVGPVAR